MYELMFELNNCGTPEAHLKYPLRYLNSGVRLWGPRVGTISTSLKS